MRWNDIDWGEAMAVVFVVAISVGFLALCAAAVTCAYYEGKKELAFCQANPTVEACR